MESHIDIRIDKWLWAVRFFKTRKLALEACQKGHVKIDDTAVKPSRRVRLNETAVIKTERVERTIRVIALTNRRVGPKLTVDFYEDLTDPEEYERAKRTVAQRILMREKGSGRPTKKERREMGRFMDDGSR
jgi:ribosome-associated heat shock protein Hsp15